MLKKFSSRRKKIHRAEKKFIAPKKNSSRRKFFLHAGKKIGRAEKFFGMTKKIRRDENFHENFGHAENFFGATNFYVRKLGMPKKFLSCRKWKGIISACPIFALYPGLALIHSTLIDDLCQINTPLCSSLMTRVVKSLLNQQESSKDLT